MSKISHIQRGDYESESFFISEVNDFISDKKINVLSVQYLSNIFVGKYEAIIVWELAESKKQDIKKQEMEKQYTKEEIKKLIDCEIDCVKSGVVLTPLQRKTLIVHLESLIKRF